MIDFNSYLEEFIDIAFKEDIGEGDHTSLSTIPKDVTGSAQLLVKQDGVLAGVEIVEKIFKNLDPECTIEYFIKDGSSIKTGDVVFKVNGKVIALLQAERLVLNILQRMSGIATQTRLYVDKLKGLNTKVLDTRKTTPGMRLLDKMAVKLGGGENHRIGLFDMILIKDNHIDFAGGIVEAVNSAKKYVAEKNLDIEIEVEVRSIDDIKKVLPLGGIKRLLLDNFSPALTKEAVKLINGAIETESSGGITIENLRDYAECGVDFISVGALTHQIKSLDLSLKAIDY